MPYKPPVAVYDACVLYPFHLRNVLIQCAVDGLVEARWTDDIHAEWIRNLAANTSELSVERLQATRDLMKAVLPDADVANYQSLVPDLRLPDPDDRHVLAAAIAGKASIIVTWNLKDFPAGDLLPYGVACKSPDVFLSELYGSAPQAVAASLVNARQNLRKTVPSIEEFHDALSRQGLVSFLSLLNLHA